MNITGVIRWNLGSSAAELRFSESDQAFSIDTVFVPAAHRGRGVGRGLVRHVLVLADCLKKDVYVSARPIGRITPQNLEKLVLFYQGFGFQAYDRGQTVVYMRRRSLT